ncbi:MAG: superoxide dismutase [Cu-Zn] SodC2 [Phenylobacterium sp.]|uniref:superoxide dismutase family protein n=1 Tax=Phenylobacterium sp. TaxID=1871053 RepID=UPI0025EF6684|nr:superoxide dismutase family protein [Phenylobacterium sp.]MBA4011697.1 superoxide dismutase [Cu-Zn] SodC2 [Phenylobacterium sp.]
MLRIGPIAALLTIAGSAQAAEPVLTADMVYTSAVQTPGPAGVIKVTPSPKGALFTIDLHDLPPGPHGFHVHEAGSCADAPNAAGVMTPAGAAGPHWDPARTAAHRGPHGDGHLADLPRIEASVEGRAVATLTAPRITDVAALKGHAVIVHVGADTYSDTPDPLGGGGARLACGVLR